MEFIVKKFSFFSIFFLLMPGIAFPKVLITTNDGRSLQWSNQFEENGSYCTEKNGGKFCIPKSDVVSIVDAEAVEENAEAVVIAPDNTKAEPIKALDRVDALTRRQHIEKIRHRKFLSDLEEKKKKDAEALQWEQEKQRMAEEERKYKEERDKRIEAEERRLYRIK